MQTFTGTYSPEDNKLRLYPSERLEKDLYLKVKEAGYKWAPRQKLFVAPMWTPERRNFLTSLCGEIQDEQMSVEDRAKERAERFNGYEAKRLNDANTAYQESQNLADQVPMGQPILIGHHSQRKAEKQAQRIESTMQKAVKMWDCSEYWQQRARGVLSSVAYKERIDVRLRRIKKLVAMRRKEQKEIDENLRMLALWNDDTKELDKKRALGISGFYSCHSGVYSQVQDDKMTPQEAKEKAVKVHQKRIDHYQEWVDHNTLRIDYENAILKAQGYIEPAPTKKPKLPPIVNYDGEGFHHLTKAEFKKISADYRFCRTKEATESEGVHRVRFAQNFRLELKEKKDNWGSTKLFIIDQKIVLPPTIKAA